MDKKNKMIDEFDKQLTIQLIKEVATMALLVALFILTWVAFA
jgi:hypothetical protein